MHERRALGLLVALACAAVAPAASAYHDEHEIVTDTAYTLGEGRMRLGLWRYDLAATDWLDVGTYPLFWVVPFPNVQAKARIWHSGRWAFALRTGLYWVDLGFVPWGGDRSSDASIVVFPFELWFSMPIVERWGLTLASISTIARADGAYDPSEFRGAGVFDDQQFAMAVEWRVTRVVALVLTARWLVAERLSGNATVVKRLDDFTTVEITGAASIQAESVRNAGYVLLSSVLAWKHFNLRVGVGGGNYNVPAINLMLPQKGFVGELDVYWEW